MFQQKVMPSVLVIMALLPIFYIAAPLLHLFTMLSWPQITATLSDPEVDRAIVTSLVSALITTAGAFVFGLPTAFMLSLRNFFGKRWIESILIMPLVLPPLVGGIGQLFLYGPLTLIGTWFAGHHIELTNSIIGVILAQSYITSPFMILTAKAGFEEIPRELKEVTQTLGGGLWHIFWHVSVPLARSAILSGVLLTFARAIGEFGATMIMAYHPYTIPVDMWVLFTSGGLNSILSIAAVVTFFTLLIAFFSSLHRVRN